MERREFILSSGALALALRFNLAHAGTADRQVTLLQSGTLSVGWRFGARDLTKYLTLAGITPAHQPLEAGRPLPPGPLLLLFDPGDSELVRLRAKYTRDETPVRREGFRISTYDRVDAPGHPLYLLEGSDTLGQQFCCYEFLERYAGVRFLHPDFEHIPASFRPPGAINTPVVGPEFTYRGLYPWNYNYEGRGTTTFCDINAHFEAKDWGWFERLGDWLIKNKQNTFFWFDDVFDDNPVSSRFPKSLKAYWRERGLRQVLGMGWCSNEGRPRGGKWETLTCVDADGRNIETDEWRKTLCPQVPEYLELAEKNIADIDFNAPEAIGALIGYGENTWAAHQKRSLCHRHADIPSDTLMERDLELVRRRMKERGAGQLPVGFVISTHSADKDSPFVVGNVIKALPANGLASIHVYQQDTWKHFSPILDQIRQRNAAEKTNLNVIYIGEVAFLCNYDIPLFRPSILRRREAHMRTVPRQDTLGHLVTLNTTQYLYWLKSYQIMRWQWQNAQLSWGEELAALGEHLFGAAQGRTFAELVGRFTALDLMQPQGTAKELLQTSDTQERIQPWSRYTPSCHSDEFGFYLWVKGQTLAALEDAEENVAHCLRLNEQLNEASGELYRRQFYHTLALTAHYHAIRIHAGKAEDRLAQARQTGSSADRTAQLRRALDDLTAMKAAVASYDRHLAPLLTHPDAPPPGRIKDLVFNPSAEFIDARAARVQAAITQGMVPAPLFFPPKPEQVS